VNILEFPALALQQGPSKTIYSFGLDGKSIAQFATVARAGHSTGGQFVGYQRPEVRKHVAEIKRYLESGAPMVPNAVVLAFDNRVQFLPAGPPSLGIVQHGVLRVPCKQRPDDPAAAWVVDGQQRLAAIREANVRSFPIFAVAFIASTIEEQREQFLLVNSTKPLPRALIHELLPGVSQNLPTNLAKRQVPASIVGALNSQSTSPLYGIIATATNPGGRVKDNSMLRVLESSLSDGVLYRISRSAATEDEKWDIMMGVLCSFWNAVRDTWPDIWDLGPRKSRLLHGAGVVTLGFLMDAMSDRRREDWPDYAFFRGELAKVKPHCRWNEGYWEFGPDHHRHWNEIQNTPKDVQLLANYLNRLYLRTWSAASTG
jgi:DGQHR domain-containing protein